MKVVYFLAAVLSDCLCFEYHFSRALRPKPVAEITNKSYQECTKNVKKQLYPTAKLVVEAMNLIIPCHKCLPPGSNLVGLWRKTLRNSAREIPVHFDGIRVRVRSDLSLEIEEPLTSDSAEYRCSNTADYHVDVVDTEPFRTITAKEYFKEYPLEKILLDEDLIVFYEWTEWSPCDRCGKVGLRRRHGICHVAIYSSIKAKKPEVKGQRIINATVTNITEEQRANILKDLRQRLKPFPKAVPKWNRMAGDLMLKYPRGMPCRSHSLRQEYKSIPLVKSSQSIVMFDFCKIPCSTNEEIKNGNEQGVFNLSWSDFPVVKRHVLYKEHGSHVVFRCPGNLAGEHLTWKNGTETINPSMVHRKTHGRVKIDWNNKLRIRKLLSQDERIYSCWRKTHLIGTVNLKVTKSSSGRRRIVEFLDLGVFLTFFILALILIGAIKNRKLGTMN